MGPYALRACPDCRLEFLDPQPDESVLKSIYSDDYFLGASDEAAALRRSEMKSATAALFIDTLARLVEPAGTELLEIGCGHGEGLLAARDRGFAVTGVEISPHAAAVANRRLGAGTVELALPHRLFGAVLAADVIEHARDPEAWLAQVYELLRPGGVLMLITPSLDSWTRRLMRRHWMEYKTEHLYYFGALSMRRLLEHGGFADIRIAPSRKVVTIDYLARHFERFRVPLVSPILGSFRKILPASLAHRHLRLPAGGLMAIARKPGEA